MTTVVCGFCEDFCWESDGMPIGVELSASDKTIHKCPSGRTFRLVGMRSANWFVIEEDKSNVIRNTW